MTETRRSVAESQSSVHAESDWGAQRVVAAAVVTSVAYLVGTKVGLALTLRAEAVSVLWPPNALLLAALLLSSLAVAADDAKPNSAAGAAKPAEDKPHIDVVFCIDCSGSMGPVIETAKQKVWAIVNEVAKAKPSPVLRIGLLGYGNADASYRAFDLTDDLDEVYKNLVTFKDEGWGDEWVGLAVHKATAEMHWS